MTNKNSAKNNKPTAEEITLEKTLTAKQYSKLADDLRNLIETGIDKANKDNVSQLTVTYWKIGERINKASLSTKANYHNSILRDLSDELELERSTLSRCLNFFRTYQTPPNNQILSWSHYRELLTIKDDKLRTELEKKAQAENWSKERLIKAIRQKQNEAIDPKNKNKIKRPSEPTFLYYAKVLEVIDGDTIIVDLDLGFQVKKEQRMRLANINSKESYTEEGQKAYHFLRDKLATTDQLLIKSQKIDIYGRYLAHIFYDPNPTQNKLSSEEIFKKGNYLNQEIIDKGLAEIV